MTRKKLLSGVFFFICSDHPCQGGVDGRIKFRQNYYFKKVLWIRIRIDLAVLDPGSYGNPDPDPEAWKLNKIKESAYNKMISVYLARITYFFLLYFTL
jgi:hypothetical protein